MLLTESLERLGLPYEVVNTVDCEITTVNNIEKLRNNGIIVCGGTKLSAYALHNRIIPGSFINHNFDYDSWSQAYGEFLLNYGAMVGKLREIQPYYSKFFIRPSEDTKAFNGQVMDLEYFNDWRYDFLGSEYGFNFANDNVVIAECKEIYAEYRFFVVDGEIISYSQYKSGGIVYASDSVEYNCISFAKDMIDMWQPSRAFVLDIALTANGYSVIEINNINSSGFYAANVPKIVDALDNMDF